MTPLHLSITQAWPLKQSALKLFFKAFSLRIIIDGVMITGKVSNIMSLSNVNLKLGGGGVEIIDSKSHSLFGNSTPGQNV